MYNPAPSDPAPYTLPSIPPQRPATYTTLNMPANPVSGKISQPDARPSQPVQDTLDEPVSTTIVYFSVILNVR